MFFKKKPATHRQIDPAKCSNAAFQRTLVSALRYRHDLVILSKRTICCSECAKYQGRVFSLTGKDTRFPLLPQQFFETGKFHEGCSCGCTLYFDDLESASALKKAIEYSNRPFVDDRPASAREAYEADVKKAATEQLDRQNYSALCQLLPESAPKSFNAYRRMKNADSPNFQKLKAEANKFGILL